jgi:transcriptional regulator with XRE-family HTH domain
MNAKSPNPTDVYVGSRIRLRRNMLGMSQERLAAALGVTFQQVQKYEKGTNRVGASRLQAIGAALHVPVTFFFQQEGRTAVLDGIEAPAEERALSDFLITKQGILLNQAFLKIREAKVRKSIIALTKALALADIGTGRQDDEADEEERPTFN